MIITVASGKGGTGKTSIAVNLAAAIMNCQKGKEGRSVWLTDCDVEAPNDALFLTLSDERSQPVKRMIPEIQLDACNLCGRCVEVCAYNAIAIAGNQPIIFNELCHACGSCTAQCPQKAITEVPEEIGTIQSGKAGGLHFAEGLLKIGFSSPVPILRDLKKFVENNHENGDVIIRDSSPGTSCPVVECLRDADFALLVTEPTPFGLHDLKLVTEIAVNGFNTSTGIVINKSDGDDRIITDFCDTAGLPILMRIPMSRKIAEIYSRGDLLVNVLPEYRPQFRRLFASIEKLLLEKTRVQ
jgi:MinD superfamily P-loop ATPase